MPPTISTPKAVTDTSGSISTLGMSLKPELKPAAAHSPITYLSRFYYNTTQLTHFWFGVGYLNIILIFFVFPLLKQGQSSPNF
jgi:hypothetical protein